MCASAFPSDLLEPRTDATDPPRLGEDSCRPPASLPANRHLLRYSGRLESTQGFDPGGQDPPKQRRPSLIARTRCARPRAPAKVPSDLAKTDCQGPPSLVRCSTTH